MGIGVVVLLGLRVTGVVNQCFSLDSMEVTSSEVLSVVEAVDVVEVVVVVVVGADVPFVMK